MEQSLFEYVPAEISVIIMSSVGDTGLVIMANVCQIWKAIIKKLFHIIPKGRFINDAAEMGYLNIVKWARENKCEWNSQTCYSAAIGGHLEVLKWVRAHGCEWTSHIYASAQRGGHFKVLEWLRENGCPENK